MFNENDQVATNPDGIWSSGAPLIYSEFSNARCFDWQRMIAGGRIQPAALVDGCCGSSADPLHNLRNHFGEVKEWWSNDCWRRSIGCFNCISGIIQSYMNTVHWSALSYGTNLRIDSLRRKPGMREFYDSDEEEALMPVGFSSCFEHQSVC